MTPAEIDAVEIAIGVPIPSFYRQRLLELGHGRIGDCEIYQPSAARELYEPFFVDTAGLFDPYFPFGCDNRQQKLWIIDSKAARAASIWHETVPDDWPDEQWLSYDEWRRKYLANV